MKFFWSKKQKPLPPPPPEERIAFDIDRVAGQREAVDNYHKMKSLKDAEQSAHKVQIERILALREYRRTLRMVRNTQRWASLAQWELEKAIAKLEWRE